MHVPSREPPSSLIIGRERSAGRPLTLFLHPYIRLPRIESHLVYRGQQVPIRDIEI